MAAEPNPTASLSSYVALYRCLTANLHARMMAPPDGVADVHCVKIHIRDRQLSWRLRPLPQRGDYVHMRDLPLDNVGTEPFEDPVLSPHLSKNWFIGDVELDQVPLCQDVLLRFHGEHCTVTLSFHDGARIRTRLIEYGSTLRRHQNQAIAGVAAQALKQIFTRLLVMTAAEKEE